MHLDGCCCTTTVDGFGGQVGYSPSRHLVPSTLFPHRCLQYVSEERRVQTTMWRKAVALMQRPASVTEGMALAVDAILWSGVGPLTLSPDLPVVAAAVAAAPPGSLDAQVLSARLLMMRRHYDEALRVMQGAVVQAAGNAKREAPMYILRGSLYQMAGLTGMAVRDLDTAVGLLERQADAPDNAGGCAREDEAAPQPSHLYDALMCRRKALGNGLETRKEDAVQDFERALGLLPDPDYRRSEVLYQLCSQYWALGQSVKAKDCYKRAKVVITCSVVLRVSMQRHP